MPESIKAENMGEAHLRAKVNREAQTVGNVASLAVVRTEPFPSGGAAHALHELSAQHRNLQIPREGCKQRRKGE